MYGGRQYAFPRNVRAFISYCCVFPNVLSQRMIFSVSVKEEKHPVWRKTAKLKFCNHKGIERHFEQLYLKPELGETDLPALCLWGITVEMFIWKLSSIFTKKWTKTTTKKRGHDEDCRQTIQHINRFKHLKAVFKFINENWTFFGWVFALKRRFNKVICSISKCVEAIGGST